MIVKIKVQFRPNLLKDEMINTIKYSLAFSAFSLMTACGPNTPANPKFEECSKKAGDNYVMKMEANRRYDREIYSEPEKELTKEREACYRKF